MKYITIAVLSLGAGVILGLTDAQASARKTVLTPVPGRKGWYETTEATQFKCGEQIQCDTELPKTMTDLVDAVDSQQLAKAKAKAKAAAEAEAKAKAEADAAAAAAKAKAEADAAAAQAAADAKAKAKA